MGSDTRITPRTDLLVDFDFLATKLTSCLLVSAQFCLHVETDTVSLLELPVDGAVRHVGVVLVVEKLLK